MHFETNYLNSILSRFVIEGEVRSIAPFGSGHINDTFLVTTAPGSPCHYVLQRINHKVFRDVEGLTGNILRVTRHMRETLGSSPSIPGYFQMIDLVPTTCGQYLFSDGSGLFWRLYNHVGGSHTYDRIMNPAIAFEAGKAYAMFQHLTADLDPSSLVEILPGFHDIDRRLSAFREITRNDPAGRVPAAEKEVEFTEARASGMNRIRELLSAGHIPLRVTHNDTKINNVLFNNEMKAIAVVDLDTVMPGTVLYDFGDAIRTGAATAGEDDPDRIGIDLGLFAAYASGYLGTAGEFLTTEEKKHLAFSAKFMTFIIGLRFLTDHLDGDRYFKVRFPGHNLQRARAQFRLLESMEKHFTEMEALIAGSL